MSDLVPPNTHLAPMRAVLEIAKNPPPTVQHPELWYVFSVSVSLSFFLPEKHRQVEGVLGLPIAAPREGT
jgi:hypothetical protein